MSDQGSFNRRKVLGQLGAIGGASTLGMSSKVAASEVKSADASHLRLSDRVQSIFEAIPQLRVNFWGAEEVEFTTADGNTFLKVIEIPSNFGKLMVGDLPDSDYHEVIFNFKGNRPRMEYDVPNEANAVLFGKPEEAVLFREPTPNEMEKLRAEVNKDEEEIEAYTHSSISGFEVVDSDKENNEIEYFEVESDVTEGYSVASAADGEFEVTKAETIDVGERQDEISLQSNCGPGNFTLQAYLCSQSIAICILCGSVCVSSLMGNVAGAVACFVCIASTCGLATLPPIGSCVTTAECIVEYTDEVSFDV